MARSHARRPVPAPVPTDPAAVLTALKAKFARLGGIRERLSGMKSLYAEHDALVLELLPLFVTVEADRYVINKRITLGSEVHTITPFFYDPDRGELKVKRWKSAAHETFRIE